VQHLTLKRGAIGCCGRSWWAGDGLSRSLPSATALAARRDALPALHSHPHQQPDQSLQIDGFG